MFHNANFPLWYCALHCSLHRDTAAWQLLKDYFVMVIREETYFCSLAAFGLRWLDLFLYLSGLRTCLSAPQRWVSVFSQQSSWDLCSTGPGGKWVQFFSQVCRHTRTHTWWRDRTFFFYLFRYLFLYLIGTLWLLFDGSSSYSQYRTW